MVFAYLSISLLALILISVYLISSLQDYFYSKERVSMFTKANVVANLVLESSGAAGAQSIGSATRDLFSDKPMRLLVLDSQAIVTYDNDAANSMRGKMYMKDTIKNALLGQDANSVFKNEDTSTSMDVAVPVRKKLPNRRRCIPKPVAERDGGLLGDITSSLVTLSLIAKRVDCAFKRIAGAACSLRRSSS